MTTADLLAAHITQAGEDDCWLWSGNTTKGYGQLRVDGKLVYAHRLTLSLATGIPMSDPRKVLHSCDTPLCCNPRHLRWGTQAENIQDAIDRGRWRRGKRPKGTHCRAGHKFVWSEKSQRQWCPACRKEKAA